MLAEVRRAPSLHSRPLTMVSAMTPIRTGDPIRTERSRPRSTSLLARLVRPRCCSAMRAIARRTTHQTRLKTDKARANGSKNGAPGPRAGASFGRSNLLPVRVHRRYAASKSVGVVHIGVVHASSRDSTSLLTIAHHTAPTSALTPYAARTQIGVHSEFEVELMLS